MKDTVPFFIPMRVATDDENCSTNSSLLKSRDFDSRESQSEFQKELSKISILSSFYERPALQELAPFPRCRFAKARARSNSPVKLSLNISNRNHAIFPNGSPVAPKSAHPAKFTGVEESWNTAEEDEDLKAMKEMYAYMIEHEDEIGEGLMPARQVMNISYHKNSLKDKYKP